MTYIHLVVGMAMLLTGAANLVDATVAIARRTRISLLVLAAIVVGLSATELYISLSMAITGKGDMSIGNVIGSNLCNNMMVVGIVALICSFRVTSANLRRDIPFSFVATLVVMLLCMDFLTGDGGIAGIDRIDGIVLLVVYALYVGYIAMKTRRAEITRAGGGIDPPAGDDYLSTPDTFYTGKPLKLLVPSAIVALAVLLVGGDMMLDAVIEIAHEMGVSEKAIAITVMSIGKTLPEIATCSIAAYKRVPQVALANVFAENVYNMLVILGIAALARPIVVEQVDIMDFSILLLGAALTTFFAFVSPRKRIGKPEGATLLLIYVTYIVWLFI